MLVPCANIKKEGKKNVHIHCNARLVYFNRFSPYLSVLRER